MPMSLTRFETGKILEGSAMSVTRRYDGPCPHEMGAKLVLSSRHSTSDDKDVILANAEVTGIEASTVEQRKKDTKQAIMDGFDDGKAWYRHFVQMHTGEEHDNVQVHRIQFRIDKMREKK